MNITSAFLYPRTAPSANFTSANTPLGNATINAAEFAFESDTKRVKVGIGNFTTVGYLANETQLANKTDIGHTHAIANVTGLQAALDGKQACGTYANTVHTHNATTDITDGTVTYGKFQNSSAGNVVLTRAAATAGSYGETAIGANQILGRGSSGNITSISLGANLTMTGTTLDSTGGGSGGNYTLPVSTNTTLGGVKVVSGIRVDANGTTSPNATSGTFVDAEDFGVTQNNGFDSRAALQAALDSIKTSGGTVYLKGNNKNPKAYYLSGPVFFNGSNQRILGDGPQATHISTLGPAFVTGPEPKYWPSAASYVDTDTGLTVTCRDGSNEFIFEDRYKEQITAFASGGEFGAGASGEPPLETAGVDGNNRGYRTRGVTKVHFPGHPLATGAKKQGASDIAGWELNDAFTLNVIYFAHNGKINGGLLGCGGSGSPDPWFLYGDGNKFEFYLVMTDSKLVDRTLLYYAWDQPAATGLHRISIQLDLTPGAERLDVWQDRVKATVTASTLNYAGYVSTLTANMLKAPYNIIAPWRHKDFTLASNSYEIGSGAASSDFTIVGFAGFSELLFTTASTLTRLDAATVTDGNTALPTSGVYSNSIACMGSTVSTGYDMRTFNGSVFSSWGMITPAAGPPSAASNIVIEKLNIIGQPSENVCDGISTLPTLGLAIRSCDISTGFFNSIGGFEGLVSYPGWVEECNLGSLGNHVLVAGFAQFFIHRCRFNFTGRRIVTSVGSFTKITDALVNEFKTTTESFVACFPGRSVGSGLYISTVLVNQEGARTIPKIAHIRFHTSFAVSSNDVILDRVDFGSMPAVPALLIDAAWPPTQKYIGRVSVTNCHWPPSSPTLAIRGTSCKGFIDLTRSACQQEVIQFMDDPYAAETGYQALTTSPVTTRHNDFYSVPTFGGWVAKSHEVKVLKPAEGGVSEWNVKTAGVEGSNSPPVWEPTAYLPSRNPNALSGNVLSTLHVRVTANHPNTTAPVTLWATNVNDSQANLILQRTLTGTATFDRTNMSVSYGFGQDSAGTSSGGAFVSKSAAITNNSTLWPNATNGTKSSNATIALTAEAHGFTFEEMLRVRSSFRLDIGSGSSPVTFCLGRTNYTTREFLMNGTYNLTAGDIVVDNSVRDGSWCHHIQNMIADYVFGNGTPSFPGTFHFGLSKTAITANGAGITEPSGGNYGRVAITANGTNFGPHDEYLSTWSNKIPITFNAPTGADWGTLKYGFISDANVSGNIVAKWPLNKTVRVYDGDDAPSYAAGAVQFQV